MTTMTVLETVVESVNDGMKLQLTQAEKNAVLYTLYALHMVAETNFGTYTVALYLAKAEIERRA